MGDGDNVSVMISAIISQSRTSKPPIEMSIKEVLQSTVSDWMLYPILPTWTIV